MSTMQYKSANELIKEVKSGALKPLYFLCGEESYAIDLVADYMQNNILDASAKEFDQHVLYGNDVSAELIVDAAKQFPMLSPKQLVIFREAQLVKNLDALAFYAENPLESTILVIVYRKKPDKRSKFYKLMDKKGGVLNSEKVPDYKVKTWIQNFIKEKELVINPREAELLADYLGNDLAKVANEVDKMVLTLKPGSNRITAEHIEANIGISKNFNNFELKDAVSQRDVLKANRIIDHFSKNPKNNPLTVSLTVLFNYFSQLMIIHYLPDKSKAAVCSSLGMNPYFYTSYMQVIRTYSAGKVFRILSLIREYDARGKGVANASVSQYELLKELVFKIVHL